MSKKYKEPSCEFYINKYPEYLSDFLIGEKSIALPINIPIVMGYNANDQISLELRVPKEDQELFIAYLYIENLIKQILHHHFDGIRSFRFDGEEFPFIQIGLAWSQPHPNVIYTTKEAFSKEEWSELNHPSSNRGMLETVKIIRETTTLSNDQKAFINSRLHNVIHSMEIKFKPYWKKTSGGALPNIEESQKLLSKENEHYLPKLHEHIAVEMEVAVEPEYGWPILDNL